MQCDCHGRNCNIIFLIEDAALARKRLVFQQELFHSTDMAHEDPTRKVRFLAMGATANEHVPSIQLCIKIGKIRALRVKIADANIRVLGNSFRLFKAHFCGGSYLDAPKSIIATPDVWCVILSYLDYIDWGFLASTCQGLAMIQFFERLMGSTNTNPVPGHCVSSINNADAKCCEATSLGNARRKLVFF